MSATLSELRIRAQRRADMENSSFVSDPEWNDYLNEGLAALHDYLVLTYRDYSQKTAQIAIVSGTDNYSLPADFYKGLGLYWLDSGYRYELDQFMLGEQGRDRAFLNLTAGTGRSLAYRFVGNKIYFTPDPGQSGTVEMWYIPQAPRLTSDQESTYFPIVNGWEEFVILEAAIKALDKENSVEESRSLQKQLGRIHKRIETSATQRDAARPQRVRDVRQHRSYPRRRRIY